MKGHRLPRITLAAWGVLMLGTAGTAGGQEAPAPVAQSFEELQGRIKPGASLLVTDVSGHELSGTIGGLSGALLDLVRHGKTLALSQDDVRLIEVLRRDSLWNGVVIGAIAGTAPAVYWRFADPNECGGSICLDDLLVGVIPGAAIGLVVDAAFRAKTIVFRNPLRSAGKLVLAVAPIAEPRRRGVEIAVSRR